MFGLYASHQQCKTKQCLLKCFNSKWCKQNWKHHTRLLDLDADNQYSRCNLLINAFKGMVNNYQVSLSKMKMQADRIVLL